MKVRAAVLRGMARTRPYAESRPLFGCAVITGVGAVANTAEVGLGQSVAIFGIGGVGLSPPC